VFAQDTDFQRYLADLRELKDAFGVKVYAYCLMTNHVHLLLVPDDACAGLSQLMKTLAARATRYRNRLEGRSGTLWESRFKSSIVQSDTYLLACCRYIELNPVRARMTVEAGDYPWSSYSIRMGAAKRQNWLDDNPLFEALGETEELRRKRYAEFVRQAISDGELSLIRDAIQRGQLTGSSRFVDEIAQITGKRIERRKQGRQKLE
jgi:putative transposase